MTRRSLVLSLLLVILFTSVSDGFIFKRLRQRRQNRRAPVVQRQQFSGNAQAVAQQKANRMARINRIAHFGGSFGGARYEGVGSSTTKQGAYNNCCYSGARGSKGPRRIPVAAAWAQSRSGRWFCCRFYN